jgi:hypothetical protein
MNWWLSKSDELKVHHMASSYLIIVIFVLGLYKVSLLKTTAAIVFIYGIFETVLLLTNGKIDKTLAIASIICHLAVYIPYINTSNNIIALFTTVCIGAILLTIYRVCDTWPYQTTPLHSVVLVSCIILAMHF